MSVKQVVYLGKVITGMRFDPLGGTHEFNLRGWGMVYANPENDGVSIETLVMRVADNLDTDMLIKHLDSGLVFRVIVYDNYFGVTCKGMDFDSYCNHGKLDHLLDGLVAEYNEVMESL